MPKEVVFRATLNEACILNMIGCDLRDPKGKGAEESIQKLLGDLTGTAKQVGQAMVVLVAPEMERRRKFSREVRDCAGRFLRRAGVDA
ncbi:MAG: hypothetical protein R3B52_00745 [Candidatus Paceibacterota bacterium]